MTPALSRYFDLIRFAAAVLVVLFHAWPIFVPRLEIPFPGHDAVIVFFVMSGFVIAFVTDRKPGGALAYGMDRLTRLWSVAIPAILLAACVRLVFGAISITDLAPGVAAPGQFLRDSLANLFFVADGWGVYWPAPLNSPFWSLNYEAWYYAIFAAWAFSPARLKWILASGLVLAAGPKVALLLPCWLAGAWLYHARPRFSERAALLLFAASMCAYALYFWFNIGLVLIVWMEGEWPAMIGSLAQSDRFAGDFIVAAIVTANFAAAANLGRYAAPLFYAERPIRACAGLTLSIYLYHMPLMALLYAGLGVRDWRALCIIAVLIWCLGVLTERHRWRLRAALGYLQRAEAV
jgi:peptidoglycan/LPS O-acetylase OafA/YrhL